MFISTYKAYNKAQFISKNTTQFGEEIEKVKNKLKTQQQCIINLCSSTPQKIVKEVPTIQAQLDALVIRIKSIRKEIKLLHKKAEEAKQEAAVSGILNTLSAIIGLVTLGGIWQSASTFSRAMFGINTLTTAGSVVVHFINYQGLRQDLITLGDQLKETSQLRQNIMETQEKLNKLLPEEN